MGGFGPFKWGRDKEFNELRKEFHDIKSMLSEEYEDAAFDELWQEADQIKRLLFRIVNPPQPAPATAPMVPPEMMGWLTQSWRAIPDPIKTAVNFYTRARYRTSVEDILNNPQKMKAILPMIFTDMPWIFPQAQPRPPEQMPFQAPQQWGTPVNPGYDPRGANDPNYRPRYADPGQ